MKWLEEAVARARDARRLAAERLAQYNAAVAKRDATGVRQGLAADLARAGDEIKAMRQDLATTAPMSIAGMASLAKDVAAAHDTAGIARQLEVSPWLQGAIGGVETVETASLKMAYGWERIAQKHGQGRPATRDDYYPLVEGTVDMAVALATVPGVPITSTGSFGAGQSVLPRAGAYMAMAEVLIKTSVIARIRRFPTQCSPIRCKGLVGLGS